MEDEQTEQEPTEQESIEQESIEQESTEQESNGFMKLADLIQQVMAELADIRADLAKVIEVKNAQAIDDGAVIADVAETEEPVDALPAIAEDRDYSID